jgi:hypothetical protein
MISESQLKNLSPKENEKVVDLSKEVIMTGVVDGWATFDYANKDDEK